MPRIDPVVSPPVVAERRSTMSGFTAELMTMRESYLGGRRGAAELTGVAQACISLWELGFSIAAVKGTGLRTRRILALIGRSLALRGEAVFLIRDRLLPVSDWDMTTRGGEPTAYRLSISEIGGGTSTIALAGEVLHVRIAADPVAPWAGVAPLRRARLTASMLQAVESALGEVYENMPFGSQVVPMPEMGEADSNKMGRDFRGKRGGVLLRESVNVTAAGGPAPPSDWKPADLTPDLEKAVPADTLSAARTSICAAFGVLPALFDSAAQGPLVREAQRHLAQWTLQPMAELLAEEASAKLGAAIELDMMGPTQAFDAGGSARAFSTLIAALAQAKEAGLDQGAIAGAFKRLDWE
jgi:phage portal protein BeeE